MKLTGHGIKYFAIVDQLKTVMGFTDTQARHFLLPDAPWYGQKESDYQYITQSNGWVDGEPNEEFWEELGFTMDYVEAMLMEEGVC